eukprot:Gb_35858 [translate_table: standard]
MVFRLYILPPACAKNCICICSILANPMQLSHMCPLITKIFKRKPLYHPRTFFLQAQRANDFLYLLSFHLCRSLCIRTQFKKIQDNFGCLLSCSSVEKHADNQDLPRILIEILLNKGMNRMRRNPCIISSFTSVSFDKFIRVGATSFPTRRRWHLSCV